MEIVSYDNSTSKISKRKSTPKRRDTTNVQKDSTLQVSPGPSHDLTPDDEIAKARSKEGKRRVKKVGPGGFTNQCTRSLLGGQGTIPVPTTPVRKVPYLLKG